MRIKSILFLCIMMLLAVLVGCESTENVQKTNETLVKSITPISDTLIEVEFSDGEKAQISDFTPKPLVSDKPTLISFKYNNKTYSQQVTWVADIYLVSLQATDSNSLRAEFSDGKIKRITEFSPKPLQNLEETEVTFIYSGVNYEGNVTLNAPTVTKINAIDPVTLEVTFSNGAVKTFPNFTTTPLQNGVETQVSFDYLNVSYSSKVTWNAPQLVKLEAINSLTLQATFENNLVAIISDFTPRPLPYNQLVDVTLQYYGVSYSGSVQLNLEEVTIEVSNQVIREVNPGHILGGNMGVWVSANKLNDQMVQYVKDTGATVMRFPGGNIANVYCWTDDLDFRNWDTGTPYQYKFDEYFDRSNANWTMDVHDYLAFIKKVGAVPMYSVNPFDHYVDGEKHDVVEEAVELVKLFKQHGFVGAYYEIGNENMGSWNPMLTLEDYTKQYILLAEAIKLEDPQAIIMGPVTGASDRVWFEGFVLGLLNQNKLHLLDYLTFHFYGDYNRPVSLTHPQTIRPEIEFARGLLDLHGGEDIKIAITEYNSALWGDTMPNNVFTIDQALWTVDFTGQMLVNEVDMGNIWITLHPASDPHAVIDDRTSKPSQNYWASYLLDQVLSVDNGTINVLEVSLSKTSDKMTSYVVDKGNGNYGIIIVNKEEHNRQAILTLDGATEGNLETYLLSSTQYDANVKPVPSTAKWNEGKISVEVPAYSIITININ